jgi:hypothetical protein
MTCTSVLMQSCEGRGQFCVTVASLDPAGQGADNIASIAVRVLEHIVTKLLNTDDSELMEE